MGTPIPPDAPCLTCGRGRDDPLHPGSSERGGLAHDTTPRIEQHNYDPGERRHNTRRDADRSHEAWDKAREAHDIEEWNRTHDH